MLLIYSFNNPILHFYFFFSLLLLLKIWGSRLFAYFPSSSNNFKRSNYVLFSFWYNMWKIIFFIPFVNSRLGKRSALQNGIPTKLCSSGRLNKKEQNSWDESFVTDVRAVPCFVLSWIHQTYQGVIYVWCKVFIHGDEVG